MTTPPVPIRLLPTGVPGLDTILGGGVPELSFNLIAGGPGTGKTTLAQQIAFHNATDERPALVFTVLGEPTLKLVRYQQQFSFFDADAVGRRVRVLNLAQAALARDLDDVLAKIERAVDDIKPQIVVVDSFRSVRGNHAHDKLDGFVQTLAVHLTTWDVTSFLLGEYQYGEVHDPIFTVADGVLFMTQAIERNSVVRKLQVVKMRGAAPVPGLHTYRIGDHGIHTFPRLLATPDESKAAPSGRVSTGIPKLDRLMGGGIPAGDAVVVAGPTGSGKTSLTTHFVAAGATAGESAVLVVFEEFPRTYISRARHICDLDAMITNGMLEIIYLRPLDLSVDETLHEIREAVARLGAKRVVIDSLSGFEIALAPTFKVDFSESLYRLVGAVVALGVTLMMTTESHGGSDSRFRNPAVSFLTDDIVVQRIVEHGGRMRRVLGVVKMRGSAHSDALHLYTLTETGLVVGDAVKDEAAYGGLDSDPGTS